MKLKLCSLSIIFLLFLTLEISGSNDEKQLHHYAQRSWRSISGLSHDNVTSLFRSKDGFLWAGTIEGLTRIDGSSTKVFTTRTHPGLLNNRIVGITGGNDGSIYVATVTGISKISKNGKVEKVVEETDISSVAVLKNGQVFASVNNELLKISSNEIKRLSVLNGLPEGNVRALTAYDNILYGGSDSGSFFSYSDGLFTNDICDINKDEVTCSSVNGSGNVVFGTSKGRIFVIENSKCSPVFSESEIVYDESPVISISYINNSIRAVTGSSVILIENGEKRYFRNCCNLPGKLSSVLIDEEKFMWISGDKGVTLYYDGIFSTYGKEEGLTSEMVYGMVEDQNGVVWVGTRGGGLFYYSDGKFRQVPENAGIPGHFIGGLMIDDKGDLWVGTSKGIVTFKPAPPFKVKMVNTARKGDVPLASAIFQDNSSRIWAGTAGGGIYLLTKDKFTLIKNTGTSKEDYVSAITQDSKGVIWFATSKGLVSLEKESFKTLTVENGLPDNWILSLYADKSGALFAGTMRKGLVIIMDDGRMLSLSSRKGLCSDTVFSIAKDNSDVMWFTSTHGIFSLPFQSVVDSALNSEGSVRCFSFDSQDGIKRPECTGGVQPASMIRRDGSMWFPTIEGIAVASKGILAESVPHISIDSIVIDGKDKELSDVIIQKGEVSLFEIKFTASRFIHPERLKVRYILNGYEDEWNDYLPLDKKTVVYQKVGAGDYRFKIEASGQNNEIKNSEISMLIESNSVFSKLNAKWFFAAIILISLAAIISVNTRKRKRNKKDDVYQEVTDEIKNVDNSMPEKAVDEDYPDDSDVEDINDDSPKYQKSRLDENIAESYASELKSLMEEKKPHINPDLTLPELAKKLNLSPNILSQVINGYCCQNFYNFVNTYRVEEVISMMKDPSMKEKSILDMAYEAGFKSKTTFNTIFKKHTGVTPSEFRKNLAEKPSDL
ncbi:MAG TPA: two-component regulator propeller domain-containing protein [bacterium]|nr:two-component regulator propeller domain-containing protein [bacterium]